MTQPVLYDSALSPYAQKVKLAFLEKGIAFKRLTPDLAEPDDDFLASSPRREVPALQYGGVFLFDSTIILQYIDERWPDNRLLPADAGARAVARTVEELCDTRLEAAIFALNEIFAIKRDFGAARERVEHMARKEIVDLCDWIAGQLEGQDFFSGPGFGYTDICVYPFVRIVQQYRIALPPALDAWLARVRARASVKIVETQAREERQQFLDYAARIQAGDRPRLHRDHRLESLIRFGCAETIFVGLAAGTIATPPFDPRHRLTDATAASSEER